MGIVSHALRHRFSAFDVQTEPDSRMARLKTHSQTQLTARTTGLSPTLVIIEEAGPDTCCDLAHLPTTSATARSGKSRFHKLLSSYGWTSALVCTVSVIDAAQQPRYGGFGNVGCGFVPLYHTIMVHRHRTMFYMIPQVVCQDPPDLFHPRSNTAVFGTNLWTV